ncbi:MAG: ribonuclease HI [Desulfopila sp.]|jgi:ribonuclease HI|nr:ribonuclease HI [Desulfopila sp.]
MAKKKYYAVKNGVKAGIYRSWPETEAQVKGFAGAKFKGFASEDEARAWLAGEETLHPAGKIRTASESSAVVREGIIVYTDGGAINNPGPGGYGVVILDGEQEKELCGGYRYTTNNRMELMACIAALSELNGCREKIHLFSDSSYVVNGMVKGWARSWKRNGWVKSDGKSVVNSDLWQKLLRLREDLDVTFNWVRGHAGNPYNERCDALATHSASGTELLVDHGYEKSLS